MFGEMALYSFIIVLLSGIYLTLWFAIDDRGCLQRHVHTTQRH